MTECFWFSISSITPQGGGDTPKPLSSRILVAAYWLFVGGCSMHNAHCWYLLPITYLFHFAVLMLATFGANLAAFLTVERMQTSIQARISKSQPIRQSSWLQQAMNDTYSPSRTLTRWPFSQKSSTPSSQTLLTMNTSRTWLTPRRCCTKLGRISSFPLRQMTPGIYECIYLFTRIG